MFFADTAYDFWILFAAGLGFLFAIGELTEKRLDFRNLLLLLLFFSMGNILLHGKLMLSGQILAFPQLFQLQLPCYYLLAPLLWLYLRDVVLQKSFCPVLLWHFGMALLVFLCMLPFYATPSQEKLRLLQDLLQEDGFILPVQFRYVGLLFAGAFLHIASYNVWSFWALRLLWNPSVLKENAVARVAALFLILSLGLCLFSFVSLLFFWQRGLHLSLALFAAFLPLVYLLRQRYPGFFYRLERAVKKEKYRHSQLKNIDTQILAEELDAIMKEETLYRQEDLSLSVLAERLDLSPHQLSEFLNHCLGLRFSRYLNRYRVEEAKRLLREKSHTSILEIAFAVGFASKATFNSAFLRETGKTPSAYRKSSHTSSPEKKGRTRETKTE